MGKYCIYDYICFVKFIVFQFYLEVIKNFYLTN